METLILNEKGIKTAERILTEGGLVAVPTETVYGLAANGLDADAVEKIYIVKGRPAVKPISLLISGMAQVEALCVDIPKSAYILAEAFWPGPLTIILKRRACIPDIVTSGGDTVGVRCPDHPITLRIIEDTQLPLAAPSANISDMPSPKDAEGVLGYFNGKIEACVDGGKCSVGVESTIVDLTGERPKILRMGGLSKEQIENVLGTEVAV